MRRDAPELRIIDDALWMAAHRRLEDARASYLGSTNGKLNGRAPAVRAADSKYLLTGFAECAVCGGSLMARSRDYGSRRKFGYLCGYQHQRGQAVCVNGLEAPMDITDHGGRNSSLRFFDSTRNSPGSPRRSRAVGTCQRSWPP